MTTAPTADFFEYCFLRINYSATSDDAVLRSKLHTKIRMVEDQGEEKVYWLTHWSRVLPEMLTFLSQSRNFPNIMEPESSLPHSQGPPPVPISPVHAFPSHSLEIHFNIIFLSMPRSPKWSLSLRPPQHNTISTSPVSHSCHMRRPSHYSWLDHPENIWWRVQIVKLLVI
jgi:hypothetical protein